MNKFFAYVLPTLLLVPAVASAQFGEVDTFITETGGFINNAIIPVLLAIAFFLFIWGVAQYFFLNPSGDNAENKKNGRNLMIWGIIAFVVIVSVWGLVELISGGLGFSNADRLEDIPVTPLN